MYRPLAIQYRPRNLKDVVGHSIYVKIIDFIIRNNRLNYAYLLTGSHGTGKTTLARIIARLVNCLNINKSDNLISLCEKCNSCAQNTHPDIIEIDAASNTGVDNIRDLIESSEYVPIIGKYKVFIIDEVHMLSKSAFNAFLKTLEEPKDHLIFILATTEIDRVPLTIISRCQRFDLHSINIQEIVNLLCHVLTINKIDFDKNALEILVRKAKLSIRDSLMYLEQSMNFIWSTGQNVFNQEIVKELFKTKLDSEILTILRYIFTSNLKQIMAILNDVSDFEEFIEDIIHGLSIFVKFVLTLDENIDHIVLHSEKAPSKNLNEVSCQNIDTLEENRRLFLQLIVAIMSNIKLSSTNNDKKKALILRQVSKAWDMLTKHKTILRSISNQKDYVVMLIIMITNTIFSNDTLSDTTVSSSDNTKGHKISNMDLNPKNTDPKYSVNRQYLSKDNTSEVDHLSEQNFSLKSNSKKSIYANDTMLNTAEEPKVPDSIKEKTSYVANSVSKPIKPVINYESEVKIIELINILDKGFHFEAYYFLMNSCQIQYENNQYTLIFKERDVDILNIIDEAIKSMGFSVKYSMQNDFIPLKKMLIENFKEGKIFKKISYKFPVKVKDVMLQI